VGRGRVFSRGRDGCFPHPLPLATIVQGDLIHAGADGFDDAGTPDDSSFRRDDGSVQLDDSNNFRTDISINRRGDLIHAGADGFDDAGTLDDSSFRLDDSSFQLDDSNNFRTDISINRRGTLDDSSFQLDDSNNFRSDVSINRRGELHAWLLGLRHAWQHPTRMPR